mmetsp:Transcript_46639/g.76149  ORF Transcript_46639/g.76149 Transcript_46639/m.76149 type:complete len:376 (-) Transcript_46639:818-1945(-)
MTRVQLVSREWTITQRQLAVRKIIAKFLTVIVAVAFFVYVSKLADQYKHEIQENFMGTDVLPLIYEEESIGRGACPHQFHIYDTFTIYNELDMAEVRFAELFDLVHAFVVSESTVDHFGNPKPLFFLRALRAGRFDRFKEKIRHLVMDEFLRGTCLDDGEGEIHVPLNNQSSSSTSHRCEAAQWDWLDHGLQDLEDSDVLVISEVGAVLSRGGAFSLQCNSNLTFSSLEMVQYMYSLHWQIPGISTSALALRGHVFRDRFDRKAHLALSANQNGNADEGIPSAGFHMMFFGKVDSIREQVARFKSGSFDRSPYTSLRYIKRKIREGRPLMLNLGKELRYVAEVAIGPRIVLEVPDKYTAFYAYAESKAEQEERSE